MHNRIARRRVFDRYVTERDEKRLFGHVKTIAGPWARRDLGWMMLARHTGLRVGSLVALTVGDAREALATKHLQVRAEHAKGGQGYEVFVTDPARRALRILLSVRRELGRTMNHARPLIVGRQGGNVTPRLLQQRMQHWCRAAGLDIQATPHWWRHTLGKRIMRNSTSADPRGCAAIALGHSDIRSTALYTLPDREDVELAMREAS